MINLGMCITSSFALGLHTACKADQRAAVLSFFVLDVAGCAWPGATSNVKNFYRSRRLVGPVAIPRNRTTPDSGVLPSQAHDKSGMFFIIKRALLGCEHAREIAFEQRRNIQAQTGENTAVNDAVFIRRQVLV